MTQHTKATGIRLAAEKKLAEPKTIDVVEAIPNKGVLGKYFKKDAKAITDALMNLQISELEEIEQKLESQG